jgi:hypothetical protein
MNNTGVKIASDILIKYTCKETNSLLFKNRQFAIFGTDKLISFKHMMSYFTNLIQLK